MLNHEVNLSKDRFAVVGLGDTGLSIINFLSFKNAKVVKLFDTRDEVPKGFINHHNLPLHLGKLDYKLFDDVDVIVISPGVSILYEDALQISQTQGKKVIGDIELFAQVTRNWGAKFIGITGSNGKTTVTTLSGYLAQSIAIETLVCGNIGMPVLDSYVEIIQKNKPIPKLIVLELSSFQLESLYTLQLDSAVVLNISEDHLDRYTDVIDYAYAKSHIFNNCKVQILNHDDQLVMAMKRTNLEHITFGKEAQFRLSKDNKQLIINDQVYLNASDLQLVGLHNYYNVLASLALLAAVGIDINQSTFKQALCKFQGLEHRMQKIAQANNIVYIEDSKGTNVGAVVAGVSGLPMMVHLILGGDGKGQDFTPLRDLVANKCKSVAIIGQDKQLIYKVLEGLDLPIKLFDSFNDAVLFCMNNAQSGDAVVLSPACASWDMFDNYKHRALVFKEVVYANIK